MKNVLLFLLIFSTIYAQQSQPGFDPDSYYLERGSLQLKFFNTDKSDIIDQSYHPYKTIESRTVAVDPAKILPGSVVYIPQTVGIKLNDGTYHDGYFLAHRVLKKVVKVRLPFSLIQNRMHSKISLLKKLTYMLFVVLWLKPCKQNFI